MTVRISSRDYRAVRVYVELYDRLVAAGDTAPLDQIRNRAAELGITAPEYVLRSTERQGLEVP